MSAEFILPGDIEKRSFEIIESELPHALPEREKPIIMRVIHTTADFDYCDNLKFSENAVDIALDAIRRGAVFVTDTNMALAGINKPALEKLGCAAQCFMADPEVAKAAAEQGTTRASAAVDKAAEITDRPVICVVGNAPTALMRICELHREGRFSPPLVIGAPVGFVNVVHSKETLLESGLPYIAALGRKGGSTVAAAICNALMKIADH
ncbi:MAG: precorrin-8X methylmutase [Oscillospiraceae bacterium]|nr:precorrin-8X methylmutase [Oscillospiraceae bacterium]